MTKSTFMNQMPHFAERSWKHHSGATKHSTCTYGRSLLPLRPRGRNHLTSHRPIVTSPGGCAALERWVAWNRQSRSKCLKRRERSQRHKLSDIKRNFVHLKRHRDLPRCTCVDSMLGIPRASWNKTPSVGCAFAFTRHERPRQPRRQRRGGHGKDPSSESSGPGGRRSAASTLQDPSLSSHVGRLTVLQSEPVGPSMPSAAGVHH